MGLEIAWAAFAAQAISKTLLPPLEVTMEGMLSQLDETIQTLQQDYDVPGVAVAIIKDDEMIYAKGHGTRVLGQDALVDADTIFGIGSCTKAFTALAVGMLVQEGKLGWDDLVTKYLPGFQLYDPVDTRSITVRDLLCHRAGLPTFGGDFMGYGSRYTDQEALERIRYIPPAFRLRAGFGYANLMFMSASLVIREVSGLPWDLFIRQRLLEPLGMSRTETSAAELSGKENVAQPHQLYNKQLVGVPYSIFHNGAAAGAMVSTAQDMATWLRFQLNQGRVGDVQLVDEAIIEETRTPQVLIPILPDFKKLVPRRHFQGYGLGWFLEDYGGRLLVSHSGGVDGMSSLVGFMPEEQLGYVLLTNRIPHSLNATLSRIILDGALGFQDTDWRAAFLEQRRKDEERLANQRAKLEAERLAGTQPSLPLAAYTGTYTNPVYGDVTVREDAGRLVIELGGHPGPVSPLEHWHTDIFFCRWAYSSLEESFIPFTIGLDGRAETLTIKVAEFVDPLNYTFKRK